MAKSQKITLFKSLVLRNTHLRLGSGRVGSWHYGIIRLKNMEDTFTTVASLKGF